MVAMTRVLTLAIAAVALVLAERYARRNKRSLEPEYEYGELVPMTAWVGSAN
jgi:hypothetical protein